MRLYLKIINRNLIDPENWNSEKEYPIDEGAILTENYNETLDSFNCHISHVDKMEIEPFDDCVVYDKDNEMDTRYFDVDSYVMTQDTLGTGETTYSYDISLFSQTKNLEGTILPNLSITHPYTYCSLSLYNYLTRYINLYSPKIRVNNSWVNKYDIAKPTTNNYTKQIGVNVNNIIGTVPSLVGRVYAIADIDLEIPDDEELVEVTSVSVNNYLTTKRYAKYLGMNYKNKKTYFGIDDNVVLGVPQYVTLTISYKTIDKDSNYKYKKFIEREAPEMQWNAPTFRELLTDLMMVVDCIPVVRNNVIEFIDLTEKKNEITGYNYLQESQSSEDYCSEIKMNLQNTIESADSNIHSVVSSSKNKCFTSESAWMTTNDGYIKTNLPILKIVSLKLTRFGKIEDENVLREYDITDFVKEKKEYDTLPVYWTAPLDIGWNRSWKWYQQYQNFCLFYERGGNKIDGWHRSTSYFGTQWNKTTYEILMLLTGVNEQTFENTARRDNMVSFTIEYETLGNEVVSFSKDLPLRNERVIVDNQTNSWVDAYAQGNLEQQKVNRLGNKQIMYNMRYSGNYDNVMKIGDYKNDDILYKVQYQIHKDHIESNAFACKNYILRNFFTGVNSKIRTWVNAQDEAFVRHDLEKFYCELSTRKKNEIIPDNELSGLSKYVLSALNTDDTEIKPIKYSKVYFYGENQKFIPVGDNDCYSLDLVSRQLGNSITFTLGLSDNWLVEKIKTSTSYDSTDPAVTNKYPSLNTSQLEPIKYVDEQGEYRYIYITLTEDMTGVADDIESDIELETPLTKQDAEMVLNRTHRNPLSLLSQFSESKIRLSGKSLYKDNKEITRFTIQLEYCSDTQDIYFTDLFVKYQKMIRNIELPTLKYYIGKYKYNSKNLPEDAVEIETSPVFYIEDKYSCRVYYELGQTITDRTKGFYITNENNEVVLAERLVLSSTTAIFFMNILKSRNYSIYNNQKQKIGEI